jgi:phosphoesterase RecJ-like protein
MTQLTKQIHQLFTQAHHIVIIPHQNPDGDAMGSATAFMEYLNHLQKKGTIFCATPISEKWHFLHHPRFSTCDPELFKDTSIDLIVVLDSGDLRYAGVDHLVKDHPAKIINIDHHQTNEHFGHFNLVIPTAASTTEVLYTFFRHNHIPYTPRMATALLTGFITDTDSFTNAATSADAMAAAGELLRHGGNLHTVTGSTVRNKSLESLKLWGIALSRLQKHEPLDITYTYITQEDLKECNIQENEVEGIANLLNNLENTKIAMVLKQTSEGSVKGSLRTTRDDVDVSLIAQKMGGGGHKKAAGFSASGTIQEVLNTILTSA